MRYKRVLRGLTACMAIMLAFPVSARAVQYAQPISGITASTDVDALFDAAFLVEQSTNTLLYSKAAEREFSPVGGAVSLMVACIVANEADLEQEIPVIDGVDELPEDVRKIDLIPGRRWLIKDLVAAMLLHGAQDAALVLCNHVSGSEEAFAELMNEYAAAFGMAGTYYVSPLGGYDSDQTTNVADLALLARAVISNDYLRELLSLSEYDTANGHNITNRMEIMQPGRSSYDARAKGLGEGATSNAGTNTLIYIEDARGSYIFIGYLAAVDQKECEKNAIAVIDHFDEAAEFVDITAKVGELLSGAAITASDGSVITPVAAGGMYGVITSKNPDAAASPDIAALTLGEFPSIEAAVEIGAEIGAVPLRLNGADITTVSLVAADVVAGHANDGVSTQAEAVNVESNIPIYSAEDWESSVGEKSFTELYGSWLIIGAAIILAALVLTTVKFITKGKRR